MSLYGEYLKELYDKEIMETNNGFASYQFLENGDCYIIDIYVRPDCRKEGMATKIADMIADIAKKKGSKFLIGSVNTTHKYPTEALKVLLAYGFIIDQTVNNAIILKKEIL